MSENVSSQSYADESISPTVTSRIVPFCNIIQPKQLSARKTAALGIRHQNIYSYITYSLKKCVHYIPRK